MCVLFLALRVCVRRSFVAEATIRAARANKVLYARESGSNKMIASRACCLSLVRQLFHIGEIEAYTGERRKKPSEEVRSCGKGIMRLKYPHSTYYVVAVGAPRRSAPTTQSRESTE